MKFNPLFCAVAASALIGGAAFAQSETPAAAATSDVTAGASMSAPAGDMSASTTTTTTTEATPSAPSAAVGASTTTSTTTDLATGTSVSSSLTTNGPVPDTAENRARYGTPMSNAGKRTKAAGN